MSDSTAPGEQSPEGVEPRSRLRLRGRQAARQAPPDVAPPPADSAAGEALPVADDDGPPEAVTLTPRPDREARVSTDEPALSATAEPAAPGSDPADGQPGDDQTAPVRRRRRRRVTQVTEGEEPAQDAAPVDLPAAPPDGADVDVAPPQEAGETEEVVEAEEPEPDKVPEESGRRRGRRTRRGRGRRGRRSAEADAGETTAGPAEPGVEEETAAAVGQEDIDSASPVEAVSKPPPETPGTVDEAAIVDADDVVAEDSAETPTRLRGRSRRPGRGRAAGGPRGQRRTYGGISEETRWAIAEAPPRKMLVTVGADRTQIAVLEERNLVEHYVTHRRDVSYVGNIYLGRVQNVLPGMEAAFVDIGKGRNGVLYAGEVDYDEADLEGELPRIEQTLRPGQTVLVQVTKDPMGTKGARLTQHLSIAGRYCVLAPGGGMLGISRKLPDDERERLRKTLKAIKPEEYGLIVRTAAEDATKEQLQADVDRLVRIWTQVEQRAGQAEPLQVVYEEPDLVIRVIRDIFGPEYVELVVDDAELAAQVREYLGDVSPELVDRVSAYTSEGRLFDGYEVTNQIRRALEKKVWLASGGYLIVEKTEAMWVIDVNTGKFVGRSNLEETVLRNNIEAAVEIARQLRLRDMGGIIVIDFVDMLVAANRDEVLKRFRRELARDKTKSRVMEISKLGLVQMTRKNVSQGLQESFTTRCDCCDGLGAKIVESIL